MSDLESGPIGGHSTPIHGGFPDEVVGCAGCTDCCHLPEIAVTSEEADRLSELYDTLDNPAGMLVIMEDAKRPDWRIMKGPCAFRGSADTVGCRIHEDRPGSCRVFTCAFLLNLRREPSG